MYRGSHQDFYEKNDTHESLNVVRPHFNVEKNETIFVQYNKMKYSELFHEGYVRLLVGFLWKVSLTIYYYNNRTFQLLCS